MSREPMIEHSLTRGTLGPDALDSRLPDQHGAACGRCSP